MTTFGPTYNSEIDGERIATQFNRVRDFTLEREEPLPVRADGQLEMGLA